MATSTTLASLLKDDKSKVATLVACGASAAALIYYNREVRNQIANIFMVRFCRWLYLVIFRDHNDNALCRVVCLEKHLLRSGSRERVRGRGFPARLARSRSRAKDGLEDGERKRLTSSIRWSHRRHLLQASFFPNFKLSRASSLSLSLFRSHSFSLLFSRSFSLVSSRLMWIVRVNTDQYSSLRVT